MESTLREYLNNHYKPDGRGFNSETFANLVGDYYSHKGMEWTADDEAVIREYGYRPQDYLDFSEEQLARLDEIQEATIEYCKKLIQWPEGHEYNKENEGIVGDLDTVQIWSMIADMAADFLNKNGFSVYFPLHRMPGGKDGIQYITDEWE